MSKMSKSKQKLVPSRNNQLAITVSSKMGKGTTSHMSQTTSKLAAKTSRVFAPKLNKDLPLSPTIKKSGKNPVFGQNKKSLQTIMKKYLDSWLTLSL